MRFDLPFTKWSDFPLWFRIVTIVAFINFFTFISIAATYGGDAINGYKKDGKFYLGSHGTYTSVTQEFWLYSYYHTIFVWVTHALVFIGLAILLNTKKAEQDAAANP